MCHIDTLEKLSNTGLPDEGISTVDTTFSYYLDQMININEEMFSLAYKLEIDEFKYRKRIYKHEKR